MGISIKELKSKLNNGDNINIIDIRDNFSFGMGHIPGALNIPKNMLVMNHKKYLSLDKTYYIYCQSGNSSNRVVDDLNYFGYNTINIDGGYNHYLLMK